MQYIGAFICFTIAIVILIMSANDRPGLFMWKWLLALTLSAITGILIAI